MKTKVRLNLGGVFKIEHIRKGKVIQTAYGKNDVVNEGLDKLLDVMFHGTIQITTWYLGLIDNSGFTGLSNSDTLASHTGWTEFTTYTGTRQEWTEDAASGQEITNTTVVTFDITGTATVYGAFLCSVASGTSGTLWATAPFSSTISVINGDQIKITYTVTAARV